MVIKMLQAISDMLKITQTGVAIGRSIDELQADLKSKIDVVDLVPRVQCAKTMLDKVIEGMIDEEKSNAPSPTPEPIIPQQHKPVNEKLEALRAKKAGEVQLVVDHGKVVSVNNATADTKIELDGKVYTATEAIGKSFTNGRIL